MKTAKNYPDIIKRLNETQDVQSHGYYHKIYQTEEGYLNDMKMADDILRKNGIKVKGFSAPYGTWNEEMGKALNKMKYAYSSEFFVGNKVFPFFPTIENKKSNVLEVPVFGVAPCDLLRFGYPIQNIKSYFKQIINIFYENQIPIFLYGHVTNKLGKYPEILDYIFKEIEKKDDVWITNISDYANFWIKNRIKHVSNKLIAINVNVRKYNSPIAFLFDLRNLILGVGRRVKGKESSM